MNCDRTHESLGAYLDCELPTVQSADLETHVSTCAACAAEIALLLRTRRMLQPARAAFAPSADFKRRLQRDLAPRRKRLLFLMPGILALTALFLASFVALRPTRGNDPFSEIADLHINALATSAPLDVISTDRHTVKPWLEGKIPFSFNLPDFAGTSYTLLGAKLIYVHQQPAAQLLVSLRQHRISVLVFQQSAANPLPNGSSSHNSFAEDSWPSGDLSFVAIGDIPPTDLAALSQSFKDANR